MDRAFFNPDPEEYARWVAARADLGSVERIGESDDRSLFLLSRDAGAVD
jgi:hypothetical protein